MSDVLKHYGVLGMRWGHRKKQDTVSGQKSHKNRYSADSDRQKESASKDGRQQRKEAKQLAKKQKAYDRNVNKNWWKAHNAAARSSLYNGGLAKLNQKYSKVDFSNQNDPKVKAAYQKYLQEHDKLWAQAQQISYNEMFGTRPGS